MSKISFRWSSKPPVTSIWSEQYAHKWFNIRQCKQLKFCISCYHYLLYIRSNYDADCLFKLDCLSHFPQATHIPLARCCLLKQRSSRSNSYIYTNDWQVIGSSGHTNECICRCKLVLLNTLTAFLAMARSWKDFTFNNSSLVTALRSGLMICLHKPWTAVLGPPNDVEALRPDAMCISRAAASTPAAAILRQVCKRYDCRYASIMTGAIK